MKPLPSLLFAGLLAGVAAVASPVAASEPPAAAGQGVVEPQATQALRRMSAYLGTLTAFEATATTAQDLVLDSGQKVQLDAVTRYRVRRPDGFAVDVVSDTKARQFVYDGRQFTMNASKLGLYSTVPAPATIRGTIDELQSKYGIALPLEDLFRWSDPNSAREASLDSGFYVGTATLDGIPTEHYAFRQGDLDWQVWISTGDQPLPRKMVIIDRTDPERPAYIARLAWNVAPTFTADTFRFRPDKAAMAITLAPLSE